MGAVAFGLICAAMWSYGSIAASRAVRIIDHSSVVAWVMLVGFAIWLPVVLASGVPPGFTPIDYFWLAASGVGNVLGLMATYAAYRIGKVGVVAAVASTEGAIVALIAVAAGEHVAPLSAALLAVIVASVVVVAATRDPAPIERAHPSRAALLAGLSAALFGISLYATSQLGRSVSLAWAVLPPRALGVAVLAIPLVIRGRLQSVRKAMPLVISTGVSEVLGACAYVYGSRSNIAIASVLAAQFPVMSAVAAFILFRERLSRTHLAAVIVLVGATATLAVVSAS